MTKDLRVTAAVAGVVTTTSPLGGRHGSVRAARRQASVGGRVPCPSPARAARAVLCRRAGRAVHVPRARRARLPPPRAPPYARD